MAADLGTRCRVLEWSGLRAKSDECCAGLVWEGYPEKRRRGYGVWVWDRGVGVGVGVGVV
jgi:hypothetical protein